MRSESIPWPVWRLALVIVFGAFMSGLDASVVNVGLDTVARDLDADLGAAQWVANGYLIALAVSLPACGWLGRRVGVGRLWLAALLGFTVASGLCALAPSLGWLIALRVVQGLTAGLLIPAGQTILGQAVGPARLGRVMATLALAVGLAPVLGPTVGGVIVHVGSWPWLFLINLPIGLAGLLLGLRYIPRGTAGDAGRLDWTGLLLVTAGLPLVVYGCTAWGEQGTLATPGVYGPLLGGFAALVAFGLHARRAARPVLDLALLRNRSYAAACVTIAFGGATFFGAGLLYPLYFQLGRGESPLSAGLLLISLSLGTMLVMPWSGRLVDRFGGGLVSVYGAVAVTVMTVPFAVLDVTASEVLVQVLLFLRGMALALTMMPATTAAYKAVTMAELPDAATQVNIVMRVGGALGGAIFAVVLASRLDLGRNVAFHTAFWWLAAASLLGLAAAIWLARTERRPAAAEPLVPVGASR